jgi:hypothetical protein
VANISGQRSETCERVIQHATMGATGAASHCRLGSTQHCHPCALAEPPGEGAKFGTLTIASIFCRVVTGLSPVAAVTAVAAENDRPCGSDTPLRRNTRVQGAVLVFLFLGFQAFLGNWRFEQATKVHTEESPCCPWSPVSSWTSIKSFGRPDAFLFRKRASKPMNLSVLPRYSDCTTV